MQHMLYCSTPNVAAPCLAALLLALSAAAALHVAARFLLCHPAVRISTP